MGYGFYVLPDGREAGYGVEAAQDLDGCETEINRGLGYLCGDMPDGHRDSSDPGCGRYFCGEHESLHSCPNPLGYCICGEPKRPRRALRRRMRRGMTTEVPPAYGQPISRFTGGCAATWTPPDDDDTEPPTREGM